MIIWLLVLICYGVALPRVSAATEYYVDIPLLEDTYIEEYFPDIAPWNNRNLFLGTDSLYNKGRNRIFFKVDTSELRDRGILPSDITSAHLLATSYLYQGILGGISVDSYVPTSTWSMYSLMWQVAPGLSTKKDSTVIDTPNGRKSIAITKSLHEIYTNNTTERGIALKLNPESGKAVTFWATGCDSAQTSPRCAITDIPQVRVFYTKNAAPTRCKLESPASNANISTTDVPFKSITATDPEGDTIYYQLQICRDEGCIEQIAELAISNRTNTIYHLEQGSYFSRCQTTDTRGMGEWSEPSLFTIDIIAPSAPEIHKEPQFTGSFTNSVSWLSSEVGVEYQVISSERETFNSYNTYSSWTKETTLQIEHAKEKAYYYKVRAKDPAGNLSEWSAATFTIIDTSLPKITYFKSNRVIIAPKKVKSGIENTAYIQGSIDDANVSTIEITIYSRLHEKVANYSATLGTYLWVHWPEITMPKDGQYYAILTGKDKLDRVVQSDPLQLTVDTTPPKNPTFTGVKSGETRRSRKLSFTSHCETATINTTYISGKVVNSGSGKLLVTYTSETDGEKTIKSTCTDALGNKSEASILISIDTTPPSAPSITLNYEEAKQQLLMRSYCREKGSIQYYKAGILLSTVVCQKESYAAYTYHVIKDREPRIVITARMTDTAGNWSALTEKSIILQYPKDTSKKSISAACVATYNLKERSFITKSCVWPTDTMLTYLYTKESSTSAFTSYFQSAKYASNTTVSLTIIDCKPITFWDPRTWFTCVEETQGEMKVSATLTPLLTTTYGLDYLSNDAATTTHPKAESLEVKEQYIVTTSLNLGSKLETLSISSPQKNSAVTLKYPESKKLVQKYFTFPFNKFVAVSQWHGKTAYQNPHAGIDFSVANERIQAVADGEVISAAYHRSSECFAGGYYLGIKHGNGMYSYYFHLENLKDSKNKVFTTGQKVTKGTPLTRTGNSGMYNCEKLAYHLHFEIRTSTAISSHINPVPYVETDWSKVVTAKVQQYPGRLSGDNPHPSY